MNCLETLRIPQFASAPSFQGDGDSAADAGDSRSAREVMGEARGEDNVIPGLDGTAPSSPAFSTGDCRT